MDVNGYITEKWLCNIPSTTLLKRQCCRSSFSSPMHCFPSLPPAGPSSPTSHPLPSSSTSKHSVAAVGLVFSESPTAIWWPELTWRRWPGHTAKCKQRARLPFSAAPQPTAKFPPLFLQVAVKPGGTNQGHCPTMLNMWRWEVRKCHRLTQVCVGAEEHR